MAYNRRRFKVVKQQEEFVHALVRNNEVIYWSTRKLDVIYKHQRYRSGQRVAYKLVRKSSLRSDKRK